MIEIVQVKKQKNGLNLAWLQVKKKRGLWWDSLFGFFFCELTMKKRGGSRRQQEGEEEKKCGAKSRMNAHPSTGEISIQPGRVTPSQMVSDGGLGEAKN